MKKFGVILIIFLLVACTKSDDTYKFATGSASGVYYPLGSAISEIVTDDLDYILINAYTSNASVSNVEEIASERVDMALVQSNVAAWAQEGIEGFDQPVTSMVGVASLYSEVIQIVVRQDAGINTFKELTSKRVGVGNLGSGIYADALRLFEAHDMSIGDVEAFNIPLEESFDMLIEGGLDAIFVTTGIPNSSIKLLSSRVDVNLLYIEDKVLNDMINKYPYYTKEIIPSGTYLGQDGDKITLSTRALWVCHEDLKDELVYQMLDAIYSNYDRFQRIHPSLAKEGLSTARIGMSIKLHPGALKYYEDNHENPN